MVVKDRRNHEISRARLAGFDVPDDDAPEVPGRAEGSWAYRRSLELNAQRRRN